MKVEVQKRLFTSILQLCWMLLPLFSFAQNQPIGWASFDGGTSGGVGGATVTPQTRLAFVNAVAGDAPAIIYVRDTLELELYERIQVGSNKTIIGITQNAMLRFGGLELIGNNIIVQNLVIGESYDGDWSGKTNSTDCITIYGQNIWIDHCWFWGGADGLLDMRSGNGNIANYVTISYCRFSDHNKVSLLGSSNDNTQDRDHLKATFHHCWFDGTIDKGLNQRNPRVRYGDVHLYNNYYESLGFYCIAARIESDLVVEQNYFRDCPTPHEVMDFGLGIEDPDLVAIDNIYELSWGDKATHGTAFTPADFYSYSPDPVWDIPAMVMNEAGPFNPNDNVFPIAVNDTVDYANSTGGVTVFATANDLDPDSDDLRIAQIVNEPAGIGFIKENKIIYAPAQGGSGIDSISYAVVDTEGGIDTAYVLVFLDGISASKDFTNHQPALSVYPNPADGYVVIQSAETFSAIVEVQLSDQVGRAVSPQLYGTVVKGRQIVLLTDKLQDGLYYLQLQHGADSLSHQLLVAH